MFRRYVLPFLILWFYRLLSWSWRKSTIEPPALKSALANRDPLIMAHWHGDELAITHLVSRYRLATMTSTSRDGELMDHVIRGLGGETSRGSSTRGAVQALKGLVRLCRQGHPASMAVDGPKGPRFEVKPGVFQLSHLAKAPIFPVGVAVSKALVFEKSWNKAYLPWPFAQVITVFGEPIDFSAEGVDPKSPESAQRLKQAIANAQQQASKLIAQL